MSVNRYDPTTGSLTNIAAGQRTWVGTQAAYKAAKQAGTLPNNAIIAITDDEVDHNHYSTDEVETGMYWIDGKPIYRKVVDCGIVTGGSEKLIPHGVDNAEHFIKIDGFWYGEPGSTGGQQGHHSVLNYADNSNAFNIIVYTNNDYYGKNIRLMPRTAGFTGYHVVVTLEYTKTTD